MKTIDDIMRKNGFIQRFVKDALENIFEGKIEESLCVNKYQRKEISDERKNL